MPRNIIRCAGLPVLIAIGLVAAWQVPAIAAPNGAPASPSLGPRIQFALPIDCTPGRDCWVPNYVDAVPGKGARDYTGGVRTYEGHRGVDFAIRDKRAMRLGVTVRAAAGGVVQAVRDTMADVEFNLLKPEVLKGRDCGNAVAVQHDADWRTQYCHMRAGSVTVKLGQRVKSGAALGQVGLSGRTEFPHLHFMVFFKGQRVDPFTGVTIKDGTKVAGNLWRADTRALLPYRESNIYHAGFTAMTPKAQAARRGDYATARLPAPVKTLFVWMDIFGVHNGDQITVQLIGPKENPLAARRLTMKLKRPRARQFLQFGFKARQGSWPAGAYRGEITLTRPASGGPKNFRASRRVTIN